MPDNKVQFREFVCGRPKDWYTRNKAIGDVKREGWEILVGYSGSGSNFR